MKIALSIAGSDSGAGAGIQADLKTFSALGVYGCTAITAVTAQNTKQVSEIYELPPAAVEAQINSVMADLSPDAIKVGMVYSKSIIDVVVKSLEGFGKPVVLDPILAAGTGARLLRDDALPDFISKLMPLCTLVTPNRMEAERLSGIRVESEKDGVEAARRIKKLGAENVIVKGGHFGRSTVTDLLIDSKGKVVRMANPRVAIEESHGSGCNFSSAVTAFLARQFSLADACRMANQYVHDAIKNAVRVGRGLPVTNPLSAIYKDAARYNTLVELQKAVSQIAAMPGFYRLIPETQTNFVYALPDAQDISDVAAVRGRIVKAGTAAVPVAGIEFGASRHVGSAVLAYMSLNPSVRSAINIRYDETLVKSLRSLRVGSYDRSAEPESVKAKEGATIPWGIRAALAKKLDADAVYHTGDIGKEPMTIVFGKDPAEVVQKIGLILKKVRQ